MFSKPKWQGLKYTVLVLTLTVGIPQLAGASMSHGTSATYVQESFTAAAVTNTQWRVGGAAFIPCLTGGSNTTQSPISNCASTQSTPGSLQLSGSAPNSFSYLANSSALVMNQGLKITFNTAMPLNSGQMRIDLLPISTSPFASSSLATNSLFSVALDTSGTSDTITPSCNTVPNSVLGEKITVRSESVNSTQGCIVADTLLTAGVISGVSYHAVVIQIDPASSANAQIVVSIDGAQKLSINEPASLAGVQSALFMLSALTSANGGIQRINNLMISSAPTGPLPSSPLNVKAIPQDEQVKLTWTASATSSVSSYTATAAPGGETCTTTALSCTITGLTNGIQYRFNVVASNSIGSSSASTPQIIATPGKVPGAPKGVSASAGNNKATVSWSTTNLVGSGKITYYVVSSSNGDSTCTTSATSCVVSKLTDGTSYYFTVTAYNNIGPSSPSSASNSVTPIGPPDAPKEVVSISSGRSATISWQVPANNGATITSYKVTSNKGGFSCSTAGTSCVIQRLAYGESYTFVVKAINRIGASHPSMLSNSVSIPRLSVTSNS